MRLRHALKRLDKLFDAMPIRRVLVLSTIGLPLVGLIDYLTGAEVAFSLFYLGPVAVAAWYGGRRPGIAIAGVACIIWYLAEAGSGQSYSNAAIPIWNAAVRFGFFLTSALLLSALRKSYRAQRMLALTDSLTGLYSRRAFRERLEHDLARAERRNTVLSLAYVDVDDFKTINDTHGHSGGDAVLRSIGDALRRNLRESDTAARMGGDEFALILPETDSAAAHRVVARMTASLRESHAGEFSDISCSIGVVTFHDARIAPEAAIAAADENMYRVKRRGKGSIEFTAFGPGDAKPSTGAAIASRFDLVGSDQRIPALYRSSASSRTSADSRGTPSQTN